MYTYDDNGLLKIFPHPGCYWTYWAWDPIYKNITILLVTLTGRVMLPNITTMYSWICTKYSMKLQQPAKQKSAGYIPALAGCQGFLFFNIVFLKLTPKSKGWWLDINKGTHRTCTLDRKIMRLFNVNKHFFRLESAHPMAHFEKEPSFCFAASTRPQVHGPWVSKREPMQKESQNHTLKTCLNA